MIDSPGQRARWACTLEVLARKPGNVNRFRDHEDAHLMDFLLSAEAIAAPMDQARSEGVGAAVLEAVKATQRASRANTNLGMILLLAPLAARREPGRAGVRAVLDGLTPEDAGRVYEAIRLAKPGGLGRADHHDVAEPPSVGIVEAMRLAQDRDAVARQYVNGYEQVFGVCLDRLRAARGEGRPLESAIIGAFLELMALIPDTLIARKRGPEVARESARRARVVLESGWPDAPDSPRILEEFDAWLRADGHARNPGTTADLVCAALFEALEDGTIRLPLDWGREFPARPGG